MILRNYTPFPHLVFESRDEKRQDFGVLVLRGTFEIVPGKPLRPLQQQEPIVMADVYHGEPGRSSLRMENNLAPYKPRSDIHIDAVAHAPGGRPRAAWAVGVRLGKIQKTLAVTGPRGWGRTLVGWSLSEPAPVLQVPIRYESAYGGSWSNGAEAAHHPSNPVGVGVVPPKLPPTTKAVPAPTLLPPGVVLPEMNRELKVEGLGPIAPGWQPRLAHAGTFDGMWQRTRWPDLPEDFRFDFYNSAHPDLVYPGFLRGDESVHLTHLSPEGELGFRLPDYLVAMLCRFMDGQIVPAPMNLDSVHLDLPRNRAYLVWRGIYPVGRPLRVLEARMRADASELRPDKEG